MGELVYQGRERPFCKTVFGVYHAGFDNHPIHSDIGSTHGEQTGYATVYWSKRDNVLLYRGFNVNAAFAAMEEDFQEKKAGSLMSAAAFLTHAMKDAA
ncbi:hypothetical protein MAL1_00199 [Bacteriophage DSS3_MAL1]|nr:hypothetical protein MAL1_00199 [Bacteriophage DSS3_MAL1]